MNSCIDPGPNGPSRSTVGGTRGQPSARATSNAATSRTVQRAVGEVPQRRSRRASACRPRARFPQPRAHRTRSAALDESGSAPSTSISPVASAAGTLRPAAFDARSWPDTRAPRGPSGSRRTGSEAGRARRPRAVPREREHLLPARPQRDRLGLLGQRSIARPHRPHRPRGRTRRSPAGTGPVRRRSRSTAARRATAGRRVPRAHSSSGSTSSGMGTWVASSSTERARSSTCSFSTMTVTSCEPARAWR